MPASRVRVGATAPVSALLALAVLGVLCGFGTPGGTGVPNEDEGAAPAAATASPPASAPVVPVPRSPREPVITSNFPDPVVIRHGDGYYAYATNDRGVRLPMAAARSPGGPWRRVDSDGLPSLGPWAADGRTWAPEVTPGPGGILLLYYTAQHRDSGRQCIGVATSAAPLGPFRPVGDDPLVCPAARADAIDADAFTDSDGNRYLLYKSDGHGSGHPAAIYLQLLSADGLRTAGAPRRILVRDPRVDPTLVEAPALVKRGARYVLFYSAGVFFDSSYRTGYATADRITGPYTRGPAPLMSTEGYDGNLIGPGGADVFSDGSGDHIAFHGIVEFHGGERVTRAMYVARLAWAGDRPVVDGSPVRYEAGRARRYGAAVEFDVFAVAAGEHRIRIGYARRAGGAVRHEVAVNGTRAAEVTSPADTGKEGVAEVRTRLRTGWNTVRLRPLAGSARIAYVEVVGWVG
ncbi:hypothetical protein Acsp03_48810 [Actinomadura sp. NBRC 104412]|uniref:family 43 glycosylhydrolase n=1 Tax=Actinomadura sp. NBRC 104412 TaxID=3032203 RepID=UPI0024A56B8C|nr:family 43 glycosylhydrolase [Actinomadura sp. NBRC 104412]GLZ07415.1 hypothetical protein Acsp03_48810 [Actinomadura sp. NBRC 104412]